jgi:hypothetical protein
MNHHFGVLTGEQTLAPAKDGLVILSPRSFGTVRRS